MGHFSNTLASSPTASEEEAHLEHKPNSQSDYSTDDSDPMMIMDDWHALAEMLCETVLAIQSSLEEIAQNHGRMTEARIQRAAEAARRADVMDHIMSTPTPMPLE